MAAHETVSGIAKIENGSYGVTSPVSIGDGIDNVSNSVFTIKDGGILRWTTGNTTEYTNCTFIEVPSAFNLGFNNRGKASTHAQASRFNGNSTCRPKFYGCTFLLYQNADAAYATGYSDFDIGASDFTGTNAAAPEFLTDAAGRPCVILNLSSSRNMHWASPNFIIDGLYVDSLSNLAAEFLNRTVVAPSNLTFVNNAGASTARHVNFWNPNGWEFEFLKVRSVSIIGSGPLVLINPLGEVAKRDTSWAQAVLDVYRTFKINAINAATQSALNSRLVITDAINAAKYDADLVGGAFSNRLLHYTQSAGSVVVNYSNVYRRALVQFGYRPSVAAVTIVNKDDGSAIDSGTTLMFPDAGVTAVSQAAVLAFTEITTAEELYDAVHVYQITRSDRHNVGEVLAEAAGTQISFSGSLLVTSSAPSGYPLIVSGGDITAYTDGSSFLVSGKFNKLIAPTITFDSASVVPSNCTLSADVVFNQLGTATGVVFDGNLDFADSGTQTCNGCVIDTLTNSSGSPVTLQVGGGTTVANTPDPSEDITIVSAPVTISVTALDSGTKAPVAGAAVYIEAGVGGPLTQGTIIVNDVTDAFGVVTASSSVLSNQPIQRSSIRSASGAPNYTAYPFEGTISSISGFTLTALLINEDA